ncbi:Transporter, major facilitator family protein [Propionibacterium freudenreichii]|nr:Transporter, major facilitator family protein [Propionibacterium freudenreichii]SPB31378.1 Lysophospholipid transporter LplT [Propionibacterium freudenreichii subsp. shermanii]SBM43877.1 Transporter, major facilitator family protein [Propionibacterium freudenreichii]SBN43234.1 Transporter, major facilitator family protein [Propionibacterium freudenreichii]SBN53033.1 Transporter, major facilitator family protein [Propionibacterium freudenreichii]
MRRMFASLAVPNYRIYFTGMTVSNMGQWMARTAQSWLVLTVLTDHSATALGTVTALQFLPTLFLMPIAGKLADRFPKRRILMLAQLVGLIDAAVLSTLVITGVAELWHVYLIATIDGVGSSFDSPARQSFVSEVVSGRQLSNAISLNSASFNMTRLLGPGLAGVLIAIIGTGPVIAVNTVSFAAMIICLALLKTRDLATPARAKDGGSIHEGLRYVRRRPDLMVLLAIGFAVGGLGFNFQISNAVMTTGIFHRGSDAFGLLDSIMGVGALAAALWSAARHGPRIRHMIISMAAYTVLGLVAAFSTNYWVFALLQAPIGLATITALVTGNTLLQSHTSASMRGRVLSLWMLMITGITPVVSPVVGHLGDWLGPRATVMFGVVCVGISTVIITWVIMHTDSLRLRFASHRRGWWYLERRRVTDEITMPVK